MSNYLSDKHRAAREYAAAGWRIFPVHADKTPAVAHWKEDATMDAAQLDAWWQTNPEYNLATSPDWQGCAVVDLDPGGLDAWRALGFDIETHRIRTPRGGYHLWYDRGEEPVANSSHKIGPAIDTRGEGGYVLLPPSSTANGKYEVDDERDCAALPGMLRSLLEAGKAVERSTADVPDDLPANVDTARRFLRDDIRINGAPIDGNGSDDRTLRISCKLLDLAISPEQSRALLSEVWAPDFDEDWLESKIANAVEYRQNKGTPDASLPAAQTFKGSALDQLKAESAAQPEDNGGPQLIEVEGADFDRDDAPVCAQVYQDRPYVPVAELIPGWIEKGIVTYLEGPGGSHKSRIALQDALCLSVGKPVLGAEVERTEALYLNYENPSEEIARRVQMMSRALRQHAGEPILDCSGVHIFELRQHPRPLLLVNKLGEIIVTRFGRRVLKYLEARARNGRHTFVVFDGLMDAIMFQGSTRSEDYIAGELIKLLDRWAHDYSFSAYGIIHPSRAAERQGITAGSYATAWSTKPRAIQSIAKAPEKGRLADLVKANHFDPKTTYIRTVEKRSHGIAGTSVPLAYREGCILPIGQLHGIT